MSEADETVTEVRRRIAAGDKLISAKQWASVTGEPLGTVYSRAARGDYPSVDLGKRGLRFWESDRDRAIAAGMRPGRSAA